MDLKNCYLNCKIKVIFWVILFILCNITIVTAEKNPFNYVLVYDHLYNYAENSSNILRQYMELKSVGHDVLLVQIDNFDLKEIKEDSIILIAVSSFDSAEDYQQILGLKNYHVMTITNNQLISSGEKLKNTGLMIAIDKVYPFSDLNKLMDIAELLHDRGIDFIVTIMPVYDNYQLEAFDTYLSVLSYVSKMGGHLFIHFPLENNDGTYNYDSGIGLKKTITEYRKQGLDIKGITLPEDKLFTTIREFEELNLPFILTTERESKINNSLDLQSVSIKLNRYIIINGININYFDFLFYKNNYTTSQQSVYFSIDDDKEKLFNFLKIFNAGRLSIKDFQVQDYNEKLKNYNIMENKGLSEGVKSQLELFKDEEFEKIKGENLEQHQAMEGYDISWFTKAGIRIILIIIMLLIVQVLMGRRFDTKKYFKD